MIEFLSNKILTSLAILLLLATAASAQEICDNLIDDDNDGLIDLLDDDCLCQLDDEFEFIPNGDFELKSDCCTMLMEDNNCLDDWIILQGTPDLYDPNCMTETEIENFELLYGTDVTSTVINFGVAGSFSETFGTCTNATLLAGQPYIFTADYAQVDIFFPGMIVNAEMSIYGFQDCAQLENWNYQDDPCGANPAMVELASFMTAGIDVASWQQLNMLIVPPVDIEAIVIMVNCNNQNSNNQGIFLSMDNLSINSDTTYEYEDTITVNGDVCEFSFFLEVKDSTVFSYQWYFEGQPIPGETGPSLELNGQQPLIEGLYEVTILDDNGCSISDDYTLVIPTIDQEEFYMMCPGDSVFVVGKYWYEAGDYGVNYLDTISPCQIKLDFHIDLYDEYTMLEEETICQDDMFTFRGQIITTAGFYYDSLQTVNGCDSVFILDLTVLDATENTEFVSICTGDSYVFEGTEYFESGIYQEDYINQFGCDSILILELTVDDIIIGDTTDVYLEENQKVFFNGDSLNVEGIYADTLTSTSGCDSIFYLQIFINAPCAIDATIDITDLSCQSAENGQISINVIGANEDYLYSIDGGNTLNPTSFFDLLTADTYDIVVFDGDNCIVSLGETIIGIGPDLTGEITEDQTIEAGESATIELLASSFTPSIYSWFSDGFVDCSDCSTITVNPLVTTEYTVMIADENGCSITLSTTIFVRESSDIYIPNIFSPNDDGINEVFKLFSSTDKNRDIEIFVVFDRWGNKIYEEKDVSIDNMEGWNGRMNNTQVAQGVYAFYAIVVDPLDNAEVVKGSVTVLR